MEANDAILTPRSLHNLAIIHTLVMSSSCYFLHVRSVRSRVLAKYPWHSKHSVVPR